ncbi:Uncharacterised protein [Mycobacteroides abscessus subsp. abscessus]|nr:Uncharacterised protein [Mycobacteroides abscessus subsp. abscessus]
MGDVGRDAQLLGQRANGIGQTRGIESSRVGDDPHTLVLGQTEALLELAQEGLGIAAFGRLGAIATEDEHRQLGQIVAGQVVQLTAGEHLVHGRYSVTVEA